MKLFYTVFASKPCSRPVACFCLKTERLRQNEPYCLEQNGFCSAPGGVQKGASRDTHWEKNAQLWQAAKIQAIAARCFMTWPFLVPIMQKGGHYVPHQIF